MWAINQEDNQQNLYFLINIKSLWYNNHMKENNCPLYKSFVAKTKTIDTSKLSYQKCYLFVLYFLLYTKPVNCRAQKTNCNDSFILSVFCTEGKEG